MEVARLHFSGLTLSLLLLFLHLRQLVLQPSNLQLEFCFFILIHGVYFEDRLQERAALYRSCLSLLFPVMPVLVFVILRCPASAAVAIAP